MNTVVLEENILFLDIETVPQYPEFEQVSDEMKYFWEKKAQKINSEKDSNPAKIYERAGIYAEFGKIVCISVGFINNDTLRLKSFYGDDEILILEEFKSLVVKSYSALDKYLCAHNGKEFDFPYIARRMLINGISLPPALNLTGKKPWEIKHLDTMDMWRFGDYKNYTSLALLTQIFSIPSPKDDIDGSMVGKVYWQDKDCKRIAKYCEKDVIAIAQLYRKFLCKPLLADDKILSLSDFDKNQ